MCLYPEIGVSTNLYGSRRQGIKQLRRASARHLESPGPGCLDVATTMEEQFIVYGSIRLMEDRGLQRGNADFIEKLDNVMNVDSTCTNKCNIRYKLSRIPRRMDYLMTFEGPFSFDELLDCVHINENIDRLQTNIGLHVSTRL